MKKETRKLCYYAAVSGWGRGKIPGGRWSKNVAVNSEESSSIIGYRQICFRVSTWYLSATWKSAWILCGLQASVVYTPVYRNLRNCLKVVGATSSILIRLVIDSVIPLVSIAAKTGLRAARITLWAKKVKRRMTNSTSVECFDSAIFHNWLLWYISLRQPWYFSTIPVR